MSYFYNDLYRMHREESFFIKNKKLEVLYVPFGKDKFGMSLEGFYDDSSEPISDSIAKENIEEIKQSIAQIEKLPESIHEHIRLSYFFDELGRLGRWNYEYIISFSSEGDFKDKLSRIVHSIVPTGIIEVRIGEKPKGIDTFTSKKGTIRISSFALASEQDGYKIEKNSFMLLSYLPKRMQHGVTYRIKSMDGEINEINKMPSKRVFDN